MYTRLATFRAVLVIISVCVTLSPPRGLLPGAPAEKRSGRWDPAVPASAAADRKGPRLGPRRSAHDNIPRAPFVIRNHGERWADEIRPRPRRSPDPPCSIGAAPGRPRRTKRRTAGNAARSVFRRGACKRGKPAEPLLGGRLRPVERRRIM